MKDFRTLKVWEKSHVMVLAVYKATQSFPKTEQYGITSQIRRAAVSVPTNIPKVVAKTVMQNLGAFSKSQWGHPVN